MPPNMDILLPKMCIIKLNNLIINVYNSQFRIRLKMHKIGTLRLTPYQPLLWHAHCIKQNKASNSTNKE